MKHPRLVFFFRVVLTTIWVWVIGLTLIDGYGQLDHAQPADVIMILGAQVRAGGQPGPSLTRRVHHAVMLYQRGDAPRILCSGGLGGQPPTEAEAACTLAAKLGVPASALWLESQSHSTEENALYTAQLLRQHGWSSVLLVTDGYHLLRASLLFRVTGLTVYASPAQLTAGPMPLVERFTRENRELIALLWYGVKTALGLPITDVQ